MVPGIEKWMGFRRPGRGIPQTLQAPRTSDLSHCLEYRGEDDRALVLPSENLFVPKVCQNLLAHPEIERDRFNFPKTGT